MYFVPATKFSTGFCSPLIFISCGEFVIVTSNIFVIDFVDIDTASLIVASLIVGSSRVLFNKVSVVFLPTNVSVVVGKVIICCCSAVPIFIEGLLSIGSVRVLLVKVSVVFFPTNVSVASGRVIKLPLDGVIAVIVGLSSVLFVNVSIVFFPTNVSVVVGKLIIFSASPTFIVGSLRIALFNVLLVNISAVVFPTRVSVTSGKVIRFPLDGFILDTNGSVNVLLVKVSAVLRPTKVSVAFGNVKLAVPDVFLSVPPIIKSFIATLECPVRLRDASVLTPSVSINSNDELFSFHINALLSGESLPTRLINIPDSRFSRFVAFVFPEDNSIILSLTVILSVLTVTTVPLTTKLPVKLRFVVLSVPKLGLYLIVLASEKLTSSYEPPVLLKKGTS